MYFRIKEILLLLPVFLLFSSSIAVLVSRWFLPGAYYSQGPFIIIAFFWLLYRACRSSEKIIRPSYISGSAVVLLALLLDVSGRYLEIHTLQYFAVYFLIAGGVFFYFGRSFAAENFMLFIYLLLAIPLPGFLLDSVTFSMKILSARISEILLLCIYHSAERYGSILYVNNYCIEITPACSGMENIFGMVSMLWFLALIQKKRIIALIDLVISVPAAFISNIVRIVSVSILTVKGYGRFALEDFHEGIGVVVFLAVFFIIALFNDISFRLPEKKGVKEKNIFILSTAGKSKLFLYVIIMSLLAFISLRFQLKGYSGIEIVHSDAKNLIGMETKGWSSVDETLSEWYYSMLGTDDLLMRRFIKKGSTGEEGRVYLYFVHAEGERGPFLHRPELCLAGEGYNPVEESRIFINGFPARRILLSRRGRGLLVYYWYRVNENRIGSYAELQRNLITRLDRDFCCMMFRLSRVVDLNDVEKGEAVLRSFAEDDIPVILKKL